MATKLIRVNFRSPTGNDDLDALINPATHAAFFRGRVWRLTSAWIHNKRFQNLYYTLSTFPWEKTTNFKASYSLAQVIVCQEDIHAVACFHLEACPVRAIQHSLEMGEAVNEVFSEIQQGKRLAVLMASHPHLGGGSSLVQASLPVEVIVLIAKHVGLV